MVEEEEITLARKVARNIGRKWRTVETEDVEQHLMLWLLENVKALERWRKEPGDGKLYVSLRREAGKFCAKEGAERLHTDNLYENNIYTKQSVSKLLPFIWEGSAQMLGNSLGNGGEAIAIMSDISSAYYGLPQEAQQILAWKYRDGKTFSDIGSKLGASEEAARKRVGRLIDRLVQDLAGPSAVWVNEIRRKKTYE
jgi:DNA-directed RNA polymerase specialized sigma24 family protein